MKDYTPALHTVLEISDKALRLLAIGQFIRRETSASETIATIEETLAESEVPPDDLRELLAVALVVLAETKIIRYHERKADASEKSNGQVQNSNAEGVVSQGDVQGDSRRTL